jgi:hypothetical protein
MYNLLQNHKIGTTDRWTGYMNSEPKKPSIVNNIAWHTANTAPLYFEETQITKITNTPDTSDMRAYYGAGNNNAMLSLNLLLYLLH